MAKWPGGVTVSGYISPSDTLDEYATHKAKFGFGGYRSAADITERNNITDLRREIGMVVYVIAEDKEYRLKGGITNSNWVEVVSATGTGTGTGNCLYVVVENSIAMEAIPLSDRQIGLVAYVKDSDKEYRLVNGIDNSNWKEQVYTNIINNNTIDNSTTTVEQTNYYYNSFGCLNKSLINETIDNAVSGIDGYYTDGNGNIIISSNDANVFSFTIPKSEYWENDWIYFEGTSNMDSTVSVEVTIELKQNGVTNTILLSEAIKGNITYPDFKIYGTLSSYKGYFKIVNAGRVDIKTFETKDGITAFNINKSLYIFKPNFKIEDGSSLTPLDIFGNNQPFNNKDYKFDVIPNTSLTIVLAKVNVNSFGIDITKYTNITSTMSTITSTGVYTINGTILDTLVDGTYALVINGQDGGTTIPTYFYGPMIIKK